MVNKSLFRSYTCTLGQTVTIQTLGVGGGRFFNFHRTVQTQIIFRVVQTSACETTQTKTNTLNNSRVWSLPFSSFLTISTNSRGEYSNSAVVFHLTKTNTLTPKLSILYLTGFCSLLGVCLSAPFIYIGYNLFTNSTSGNRKNAKLLTDKQFELRKVTGAVVAYSSQVNKQVEISLFCTRHLIGWI